MSGILLVFYIRRRSCTPRLMLNVSMKVGAASTAIVFHRWHGSLTLEPEQVMVPLLPSARWFISILRTDYYNDR
jgi:hypothetical protein